MLGYIDGTTGGMMLQIVMGGLVGGFVAIKLVAKDFVGGLFRRRRGEESDSEPLPENGPEESVASPR